MTQVTSCFNGFTIYKTLSLIKQHYELVLEEENALCEHEALHKQMNSIYINPNMIFAILQNKWLNCVILTL